MAAALGDDANFSTTVTNSIATKLALAGGTLTGNLIFGDSVEARFGAASDLKIYHDGSHSYLNNSGTGNLLLYGNGTNSIVLQPVSGENSIVANSNSSVELFFDNSKKFETTSAGATVTGTITATSFSGETLVGDTSPQLGGNLDTNSKAILLGDSTGTLDSTSEDVNRLCVGAGRDFQIVHDGNDTYLNQVGTGGLYLRSIALNEDVIVQAGAGGDVRLRPNAGENGVVALTNGAVELYYDNSKKFETTSTGVDITGNLHLDDLPNTTNNTLMKIAIQDSDGTLKSDDVIKINPNQNVLKVDQLHLSSNHIRAGGNGPLQLTTANANGTVDINISNTHVEINGNLLPATDSTDNLGADATRWANVYADTLYGDGSNLTGINTDLVSDTSPQLGGHLDINNFNVTFGDSGSTLDDRLRLGAIGDLQIYHNGTNSFIENSTGILYIRDTSGGDVRIQGKSGEESIICNDDGKVFLYDDNALKFSSGTDGEYGSVEAKTGKGGWAGFSIGGYYAFLANNEGNADTVKIFNDLDNEDMIVARRNGAVELYHDNSKKFETATHGISVHGEVRVGNLHINYLGQGTHWWTQADSGITYFRNQSGTIRTQILGSGHWRWNDNYKVQLGSSDDLQIYHDGTNSLIANTTGNLYILDDNAVILGSNSGTESYFKGVKDGAVELYYDNSKKLETTNSGVEVTGTLTVNGAAILTAADFPSIGTKITATGGSTSTVSGHKVHDFTSNGTFEITAGTGEVEVLLVGGGGSEGGFVHGCHGGGGGGGGGVVNRFVTLGIGKYSVVIGGGGGWRSNGGNSTAFGFTALGGGAGGPTLSGNGNSGGSGGGGSRHLTSNLGGSATQPGSTSGGLGNSGGNTGSNTNPGGGGGAGGVGQSGSSGTNPGRGGAGVQFTQFGVNTYFGAGGNGNGGGSNTGPEGQTGSSTHGAANTGAGGGGSPGGGTRFSGGSGRVIIRYAT